MLRANMSAGDLREMDLSTTMNSDPPGPIPLVDYGNLVDPDQTNAAGGNNGARTGALLRRASSLRRTADAARAPLMRASGDGLRAPACDGVCGQGAKRPKSWAQDG